MDKIRDSGGSRKIPAETEFKRRSGRVSDQGEIQNAVKCAKIMEYIWYLTSNWGSAGVLFMYPVHQNRALPDGMPFLAGQRSAEVDGIRGFVNQGSRGLLKVPGLATLCVGLGTGGCFIQSSSRGGLPHSAPGVRVRVKVLLVQSAEVSVVAFCASFACSISCTADFERILQVGAPSTNTGHQGGPKSSTPAEFH